MSEQDTSSDQHQEIPETKKEPDRTFWKAFGLRFTISVVAALIAVCIAPHIRFKDELAASIGAAAATITLLIFIDLLIYLFAYKEEISGFMFKIFNAAKNFPPYIWRKIKPTKESLKKFALFTGLAIVLSVECFLIYKVIESFNLHSEKIKNLPNDFNFSLKSDKLSEIQDIRNSTFIYSFGSLLILLLIALPFIKSALKNHILPIFVTTVISGGILAFIIPVFLYNYGFIGDAKDLTTALLGVTGGVVALFSLIKSHQKSELEREQLDTQKQKDARDHIRQLHDSYNDRFDKAVAELNSNDVKSAYAAVPKLAKLADAWLDYKDLSNDTEELEKLKKKAEKEAQTIINILCKYIRTMPGEYTEEDLKDIGALEATHQDKLKSESEVRRLIFSEISDRSSKVTIKNGEISTSPGRWSKFDFDFTQAPIFYPLHDLTFEHPNFKFTRFYTEIDFSNSCFIGKTSFESVHFVRNLKAHINFRSTKFIGNVSFLNAQFDRFADFESSNFRKKASFENTTFDESAHFKNARFKKSTLFSRATFTGPADFTNVTFSGSIGFGLSTFKNSVDFSNAIFITPVNFSATCFNYEPPEFAKYSAGAMFSIKIPPKKYIFDVATNSEYKIETGRVIHDNQPFNIPLGSVLIDPDPWNEEKQEYIRVSGPVEPLENSDTEEEKPTE
ncbi:pentapeptide repeat-containing protein [Rothia mucilaginosa]|uniref:pentapeptide repeat-containing protein n=1 Tax=Rothia mucilaginosa TaxID=43675 RepID=UPI0028F12ED5|nr:pentapeptide repeat-containing protein [Rothia mucilaginosa]